MVYYLYDFFRWDLTLLLLPPLYLLLRNAVRKWSGQRRLLPRPYFQVAAGLWAVSAAVEVFHWIVALPPTLAYAATNYPSNFQSYEALEQDFSATLVFLRVPWITFAVTILALVITAVASRRKHDAE